MAFNWLVAATICLIRGGALSMLPPILPPPNPENEEVVISDDSYATECLEKATGLESLRAANLVTQLISRSGTWNRVWRAEFEVVVDESPSRLRVVCWEYYSGEGGFAVFDAEDLPPLTIDRD
ncbi:MAG TPA: hypothetical protein VEA44_16035 [Caulobacter sp.]|nr:hypothetical protein [Caulobacter sp.]